MIDKKEKNVQTLRIFFAFLIVFGFYSCSLIYLGCDLKFQLKWCVTDSQTMQSTIQRRSTYCKLHSSDASDQMFHLVWIWTRNYKPTWKKKFKSKSSLHRLLNRKHLLKHRQACLFIVVVYSFQASKYVFNLYLPLRMSLSVYQANF